MMDKDTRAGPVKGSFATDLHGVTYPRPTEEDLRMVLDSLEDADIVADPEVWLSMPNGITLGYRDTGIVLWEEDDVVTHLLRDQTSDAVLKIWLKALAGEWAAIWALGWEACPEPLD